MPSPGEMAYVLQGIGFTDAVAKHTMATYHNLDALEDLFYQFINDSHGLCDELQRRLETSAAFQPEDTRRLGLLSHWFYAHFDIVNFNWTLFTRSDFVSFKRQQAAARQAHPVPKSSDVTADTPTLPTILDFSDEVIHDAAARLTSLATPGSTATLKPHPLWVSPFATSVRKHVSTRTFDDTDIALLSDDPSAIVTFYRHLVQLGKSAEIDLCPLNTFDSAHSLWPKNRCAEIIFQMNDLLVIKLSKDGVLNLDHPTLNLFYTTAILENDSPLKAYNFLHQLLARAMEQLQATMPVPPTLQTSGSISAFGKDLVIYYSVVETVGSGFPPLAQSIFFLTSLRQAGIQVDSYMDRLRAIGPQDPVPHDLLLPALVIHIADIRAYQPGATHVINRVDHPPDTLARRPPSRPPSRPTTSAVGRPFRSGADAQCACCGRWGHDRSHCMQLCVTYLCMDYISSNPEYCASQALKWQAIQQKAPQKSAIRLLRLHQPELYANTTDEDILASLDLHEDSDFV